MKKIVTFFIVISLITVCSNFNASAASAAAKAGKKLYASNCRTCHGAKGAGSGSYPSIVGINLSTIKSFGMSQGLSNAQLKKIVAYLKAPF